MSTTTTPKPSVALTATVLVNGQPVVVNSGEIAKGMKNFHFVLYEAVTLGQAQGFLDWLHTKFGVATDFLTDAENLPVIGDAIKGFAQAEISLTVLQIDIATTGSPPHTDTDWAFGTAARLAQPLDLIPNVLAFDSVGVLVQSRAGVVKGTA